MNRIEPKIAFTVVCTNRTVFPEEINVSDRAGIIFWI